MKRTNQTQIAEELGISKSYLSMILSGQRKCPANLAERLQAIPGVHKSVNLQSCIVPSKQRVEGSNPSRDSVEPNWRHAIARFFRSTESD